jgi:hypothetical protein
VQPGRGDALSDILDEEKPSASEVKKHDDEHNEETKGHVCM